jgi:tRNA threonylcarbamoyladenosine biosynthesis protein TsaB
MERFLVLNTFGEVCAAGIWGRKEGLLYSRVSETSNSHATMLAPFVEACLEEAAITVGSLSAVICMKGPGSYTGLRIGLSFAKGLCLGADLPLIALNSLEAMAYDLWLGNSRCDGMYYPLIDARRMEVYGACYRPEYGELVSPAAFVLDDNSFRTENLPQGLNWFTGGDGAAKSLEFMPEGTKKLELGHCLDAMGMLAERRYSSGSFDDLAYTEAEYLKPFYSPASVKRGN